MPAIYLSFSCAGATAGGKSLGRVWPPPTKAPPVPYEHTLASDDHSMCPEVGGAAARLGRDGLLVASARSDAANVVVFAAKRAPDAGATMLQEGGLAR